MKKPIYSIKTLPHLINFFIPDKEVTVYSSINSPNIRNYLEEINVISKKEIDFKKLVNLINELKYKRVEEITQRQEFSIKGDSISFYPIGYDHPIRAEFFGDDLESIYLYDLSFSKKISDINFLIVSKIFIEEKTEYENIHIEIPKSVDELKTNELNRYIFTSWLKDLTNQEDVINTDFQYPQLFYSRFDIFQKQLENYRRQDYKIYIRSKNIENIPEELIEFTHNDEEAKINTDNEILDTFFHNIISQLHVTDINAGMISESNKIAIFTDRELFGSIYLTRPERLKGISSNIKRILRQFEGDIEVGDYVVHEDYGVAVYAGLKQEEIDGQMLEYLLLKYDKDDELYVPINQIEKITKYIGPDNSTPKITRLGKTTWETVKQKVKKSTTLLASQLLEHYAKREMAKAMSISKKDSREYLAFVDDFEFTETDDQIRAINEIISDLESSRPMNRLLVGDVGFGKTEVFLRSVFKVVEHGGQVAVLAPTTILTAQHYSVFKERFKNTPYQIRYLSRFNSDKENKKIIDELNDGKVQIVVGTHRLLSNDLKFKNLQLLIVDEEQKFGVAQKEKIKKLNYAVHLLSVSATPIPRTLSMALSSIQEISIISQAPKNRKPIHTEILKDDWNKAASAIRFEVERGGQVYFVHNVVETINSIKDRLQLLLPEIKFGIGHGQMSPSELDRVMTSFYNREYDCLISTTIIENGLDLANVNTIIINRANHLGLSQLYQLRGRVGRSDKQSFCYLMYQGKDINSIDPAIIDEDLKKKMGRKYLERLQAIVENQDLGAGFRIASRDLEIRGAGNLLGDQQSGNISTIGYALYIEMLAQEVENLRNSSEKYGKYQLL